MDTTQRHVSVYIRSEEIGFYILTDVQRRFLQEVKRFQFINFVIETNPHGMLPAEADELCL